MGHYIENVGDEPLRFLELFRSDRYADVSLAQWMGLTPTPLVVANLQLSERVAGRLRAEKEPVPRCGAQRWPGSESLGAMTLVAACPQAKTWALP